jgi:RimJ/RimL family protein N-acetyltransferase
MHKTIRQSVEVPILETERLRLRGHRTGDFDACCALWAETEVVRHTTGKVQSREEVWWRVLRYIGHWALMGYGFWALEEKASGKFIGEVGFADFKREINPSLGDAPESGWILGSAFHGKGYATEAMRAVIAWGDEHFGAVRTACLIQPDNAASLRVAEKLGYREYARSTYRENEVLMLERLATPQAQTTI